MGCFVQFIYGFHHITQFQGELTGRAGKGVWNASAPSAHDTHERAIVHGPYANKSLAGAAPQPAGGRTNNVNKHSLTNFNK